MAISSTDRVAVEWTGAGPYARTKTRLRRFWCQPPYRLRAEIYANQVKIRQAVRSGDRWSWWDLFEGHKRGDLRKDSFCPPLLSPPLLAPYRLLATCRLEPTGEGEYAGRRVVRALATPREALKDVIEVAEVYFDAEHGTVLRRLVRANGEVVHLTEVVGIVFGHEFEDELFTIPDEQASFDGPSLRQGGHPAKRVAEA